MHTVPVVLDPVPVAATARVVGTLAANGFFVHVTLDLEPVGRGLVTVPCTPLLVGFGTGALHRLTPGEVVVTFDRR